MSFLHDYLSYAEGDEAPEMFHVWCGYIGLSSSIFRKVWLPFGDSAIFPNIYVMLVGDAGNGKSFAMDKIRRILAEVPDVHISGSVETPQGMIRFMGGNPKADPPLPATCCLPFPWADGVVRDTHNLTLIANEFINFISLMPQEWIGVLNDIYDRDVYHYRTKGGGEDMIVGPYISMLAALTTEISNDLQKTKIISTGLARRTLFQFGERRWENACPIPSFTPSQIEAKARCIQRLKDLRKVRGEFTWSAETRAWWDKWYRPALASVPKKSPTTKSWFASKPIQVLKLGMLNSLSESDDLVLQQSHLELAVEYLAILERDLFKIFGGAGRNDLASIGVKIVEHLDARKEIVFWKDVYVHCYNMFDARGRSPLEQFEMVITHLKETNQVVEKHLPSKDNATPVPIRVFATPQVLAAIAARNGAAQPPPNGATPSA